MTAHVSSVEQASVPTLVDIQEIMAVLPHRYPFLMVDRVTEIVPNEHIRAHKNVTFNEPFFQGHFPGKPVMPGVLIIEGLAQAAGVLVVKSQNMSTHDKLFFFTSMENVRFRRPVVPGDRIDMHCSILRTRMNLWKTDCKAYVDGTLVAEGILTAAIIQNGQNGEGA